MRASLLLLALSSSALAHRVALVRRSSLHKAGNWVRRNNSGEGWKDETDCEEGDNAPSTVSPPQQQSQPVADHSQSQPADTQARQPTDSTQATQSAAQPVEQKLAKSKTSDKGDTNQDWDDQSSQNQGSSNQGGGQCSGPWHTGGKATVYQQNDGVAVIGQAGACGQVHSDWDMIPSGSYNGGADCGKQVMIQNEQGKTVYATVADECPTCESADCLDMSYGTFINGFGMPGPDGVFNIQWCVVG